MSITPNIDPTINFWEMYPEFKVVEPYKSLYKEDKSKGRKNSSITMWFVVMCYSKASSFRNLPIDDRYPLIGEDYCEDKNYYVHNFTTIDRIIEAYTRQELTAMERHMNTWITLLDKRTKFLSQQDYNFETSDNLDKMAVGTEKVYNTIKKIQDDLNKEDASGIGKGGAVASLND